MDTKGDGRVRWMDATNVTVCIYDLHIAADRLQRYAAWR